MFSHYILDIKVFEFVGSHSVEVVTTISETVICLEKSMSNSLNREMLLEILEEKENDVIL